MPDSRQSSQGTMGTPAPKTVTFFSYHLYEQRRKGGMHWLCESFRAMGWNARFITCDYSYITKLKGDRRTEYGRLSGLNKLHRVADNLETGVVYSPYHQLGRAGSLPGRMLNMLTGHYPWPMGGVVQSFAAGSDLVLVESCGALTYLAHIRKVTKAPVVYRVSDNIRVIRPVPSLLRAEAAALQLADVVSVASDYLAKQFQPTGAHICKHPMGLDKFTFDRPVANPYGDSKATHVVISGSSGLDTAALRTAAQCFPDWQFLVFGSTKDSFNAPNVVYKGEVPFVDLVPWVKHANIGFAPYLQTDGFEYQAEHSNRLLQYTYSGLPSVVPAQLCSAAKPHFFGYGVPHDAKSVSQAFINARNFNRELVPRHTVLDWKQVAQAVLSDAFARPTEQTR